MTESLSWTFRILKCYEPGIDSLGTLEKDWTQGSCWIDNVVDYSLLIKLIIFCLKISDIISVPSSQIRGAIKQQL